MTKLLFNIIFEGDILPGHQQTTVQPKLAKIFGMVTEEANDIFTGKQHKIKSRVTVDRAKKYIFAMAKLGAMAYMVPIDEDAPKAPEGVGGKFTETGSFDMSAYSSYFSQSKEEPEEKSSAHKIFNFDEVDKSASYQNIPEDELSGAHKIMQLKDITKKVIDQKSRAQIRSQSKTGMDREEIAKKRTDKDPDPDEISGVQKIMDLKEVGKAVRKHKES